MERKITRKVKVGSVYVGGDSPVSIQSMTNTDTRDVEATLAQIRALHVAGCEIIRCAVPDMEAAQAIKDICAGSPMPVVADIHFDYRLALKCVENGISAIRINPGNIGNIERVKAVTEALGDTGRILVRESGTEPLLRVMVEAETEEVCRKYVDQVVDVVKAKGHIAS